MGIFSSKKVDHRRNTTGFHDDSLISAKIQTFIKEWVVETK